jgi:predicted DCC family thiol-disulfide oxidoreductase YuxK
MTCGVCNEFINFTIRKNHNNIFSFFDLNDFYSETNRKEIICVNKDNIYTGAEAMQFILEELTPNFIVTKLLKYSPKVLKLWTYRVFAKNK